MADAWPIINTLLGAGIFGLMGRITYQLGRYAARIESVEKTVNAIGDTNTRMSDTIQALSNALHELKGRSR